MYSGGDDLKETIKAHADIIEIIQHYFPLKRSGTNYSALCPFHNEKTPSFYVNSDKQTFYCFGCAKGGDVIQFIMDYEGMDFQDALHFLADRVGVQIPAKKNNQSLYKKHILYELHEKLTSYYQEKLYSSQGRVVNDYLQERRIDEKTIKLFRLGYAPNSWNEILSWGERNGYTSQLLSQAGILVGKNELQQSETRFYDRFRHRLIFPISNEQGRVIAFSARRLPEQKKRETAKYINSPETDIFRKGSMLYGLHLARDSIREKGTAILCEGPFDVITCHMFGIHNVVAPQGTAFTENQIRLLKRYTNRIVFLFDSDSAGQQAVIRGSKLVLSTQLETRVAMLPEGEDPANLLAAGKIKILYNCIEGAKDFFLFFLDYQLRQYDITSPAEKAQVADLYLELVSGISHPIVQVEYSEYLAKHLNISRKGVLKRLQTIQQQSRHDKSLSVPFTMINPSEDEKITRIEEDLLELVLHHPEYAQRLSKEFPSDFSYYHTTNVGKALNAVLAYTEQGEWKETNQLLHREEYHSSEINQALLGKRYGSGTNNQTLEKVYKDCCFKLRLNHIDSELDKTLNQWKNSCTATDKQQVKEKYEKFWRELRRERQQLLNDYREGLSVLSDTE